MAFSRIGKNTRNCVIVGDYAGEEESPIIRNCQVLAGISDMEIHFDMEKDYVQCAGLDSNGDQKIWNPADLVPTT